MTSRPFDPVTEGDGDGEAEGDRDGIAFEVRLVRAVADALDRDPMEIPPLSQAVDLEALAAIAASEGIVAAFEYEGQTVRVEADGGVTVSPDEEVARDSG